MIQGRKRDKDGAPRVGYTVTKKTGNSVMRSRIKRRLRAAVAELDPGEVPQSADFVLVARDSALTLPFQKNSSQTLSLAWARCWTPTHSADGESRAGRNGRTKRQCAGNRGNSS
ncbi:ribonuclease P protein component [Roseibium salinum]|nr:ribonuclease P protein component [Roseibium salinum]